VIFLELYWSFVKIGFTSFGGLSMIPLIKSEMVDHGWMTLEQVSDIVAIAEITPGPLGINCASFAGMQAAGILGALVCNLGVLMPALTLTIIAAMMFERFKSSRLVKRMMIGIRPATLGMLLGVCYELALTSYTGMTGAVSPFAILLGAADLALLLIVKMSIPKVLFLSAAVGLLAFGVIGLA